MSLSIHDMSLAELRGGVAEASRRARGGSRRLTGPRSPRGELISVILPSRFDYDHDVRIP